MEFQIKTTTGLPESFDKDNVMVFNLFDETFTAVTKDTIYTLDFMRLSDNFHNSSTMLGLSQKGANDMFNTITSLYVSDSSFADMQEALLDAFGEIDNGLEIANSSISDIKDNISTIDASIQGIYDMLEGINEALQKILYGEQ